MSSIFLGALAKAGQAIAPALAAKGIELNRDKPSSFKPTIVREGNSIRHNVYLGNLPAYIEAAFTGMPQNLHDFYHPLSNDNLPPFFTNPVITWSFQHKLTTPQLDMMKDKYKATESMHRGKPCLQATLPLSELRELNLSHSPITTTPCDSRSINFSGLRSYVLLSKILDALFRTNQYPIYKYNDEDCTENDYWADRCLAMEEDIPVIDKPAIDNDEAYKRYSLPTRGQAYSNLETAFLEFNYCCRSSSDIPAGTEGLIFPFVDELALPDNSGPLTFINNFMNGCLGSCGEDVNDVFEGLKSGWGVLASTIWGKELAHAFWCMELALRCGGTLRCIVTAENTYGGCLLLGSQFSFTLNGIIYKPASRGDLKLEFDKVSPHQSALTRIFSYIFFASNDQRNATMKDCHSYVALREILSRQGTAENGRRQIEELLPRLAFPDKSSYLTPTAENISKILTAVSENEASSELGLPIHYSAVLNDDRRYRIFSAFGNNAPSFKVPGGKSMDLAKAFEVKERQKGKMEIRSVKKVAFMMKPLDQAFNDLLDTIASKTIQNPHGSSLMSRNSSSMILRSLEGPSCDTVVSALRRVAKVSLADVGPSSKRKAEDVGRDNSKRARLLDI